MYNKLFTKILDSSVWLEPNATRIVWITFLAMMDEDGFVALSSISNVAHRARVSLKDAERAISCLEGPDSANPDQEDSGRRIERVANGWLVKKAEFYRQLVSRTVAREQTRERVKRYRQRKSVTGNGGNGEALNVTPSEAYTEAETDQKKDTTAAARPTRKPEEGWQEAIRSCYPRRAGSQPWGRAWKACNARIAEGATSGELLAGVKRYAIFAAETCKEGTEYVMQAATFFSPEKHYLSEWAAPITKTQAQQDANVSASLAWLREQDSKDGIH